MSEIDTNQMMTAILQRAEKAEAACATFIVAFQDIGQSLNRVNSRPTDNAIEQAMADAFEFSEDALNLKNPASALLTEVAALLDLLRR